LNKRQRLCDQFVAFSDPAHDRSLSHAKGLVAALWNQEAILVASGDKSWFWPKSDNSVTGRDRLWTRVRRFTTSQNKNRPEGLRGASNVALTPARSELVDHRQLAHMAFTWAEHPRLDYDEGQIEKQHCNLRCQSNFAQAVSFLLRGSCIFLQRNLLEEGRRALRRRPFPATAGSDCPVPSHFRCEI
jgi:hypothetical protein